MKFKINKVNQMGQKTQWYFEIQAGGNYATLCHSEMYESEASCVDAIALIRTQAQEAEVYKVIDMEDYSE